MKFTFENFASFLNQTFAFIACNFHGFHVVILLNAYQSQIYITLNTYKPGTPALGNSADSD